MIIAGNALAGTLESSDALVQVRPGEGGVEVTVESVVLDQFGDEIRAAVLDELERRGAGDVRILIRDRGALDCVIRARVETALRRAERATP